MRRDFASSLRSSANSSAIAVGLGAPRLCGFPIRPGVPVSSDTAFDYC